MSWFRVEGKAPSGVKHAPLSDRAFRLWVTAGCWSAEHRTDGAIPRGIPETLTRAPQGRALKATVDELVAAKLWEVTDAGWFIHNFGDWNITSDEYARKQEAGRQGGRVSGSRRQASAQAHASAGASPNGKQVLKQTASTSSSGPQADSESDTDTELDPTCEVAAEDLTGSGSKPPPPAQPPPSTPSVDIDRGTHVPCPSAAEVMTPETRQALEVALIPGWAIDVLVAEFVARYAADQSERRTLTRWRKGCAQAVSGNWNNPNRRPRKPEPDGSPPIALKGGAVQRAGESVVAKYRAEQAAKGSAA